MVDPDWFDPLDPSFAARTGGRWNPPNSFGALYLGASIDVARANVDRLYVGMPYGTEDLEDGAAPLLLDVDVPTELYVDAVTEEGLTRLGLPVTYPLDASGTPVAQRECQPLGKAAYDDGELGVACRSAAPGATGEELAWFAVAGRVRPDVVATRSFDDWYWRT